MKHFAYNQDLLQIDLASNKGPMGLSVFLGRPDATETSDGDYNSDWASGDDSIKNIISINKENWQPLSSSETYILYNKPSFIASFTALSTNASSGVTTKLNINNSSMLFSRDRSKPVLYIKGSNYLWLLYLNSLIRAKNISNISSNIAISSDGQKLIFGHNSGGPHISAIDISTPDESKFSNYTPVEIKIKESDNTDFSEPYLRNAKPIYTINLDTTPEYLATKPYLSYKSSKSGGKYETLCPATDFQIANNAAAVASGGIYLAASGTKEIALYNPLTTRTNILSLGEVLNKNANSVAVAAYNDNIYTFGNAKVGVDDLKGRVQSYNVNTGKTMSSLDSDVIITTPTGYNDEYQVNMGLSDQYGNNFYPPNKVENYIIEQNTAKKHYFSYDDNEHAGKSYFAQTYSSDAPLPKAYYIFYEHKKYCWRNNFNKFNYYCGYNANSKVTVNKIKISNYNGKSLNNGVYLFDFEVANNSCSWKKVFNNKTIPQTGEYYTNMLDLKFNNDTPYQYYKLTPIYNFCFFDDNVYTVNLLQLWRTGVKRLTPSVQDPYMSGESLDNEDYYFNWTNDSLSNTILYTTHSSTEKATLKDIYIPGTEEFTNHISNNVFKTENQSWHCDSNYPYIAVVLNNGPEPICAVRYANGGDTSKAYVKKMKLYGSNDIGADFPGVDPDSGFIHSLWHPIEFTNNSTDFSGPKIRSTFITAEVKNPNNNKYKFYLVTFEKSNDSDTLRLVGFEMFASPPDTGDELPTEDYLTPMKDDDLNEIKASNGAACSTPYGLVYTGGFNGSGYSIPNSVLYWSHAINKYDGNYNQFGIPRSLPNMIKPRANHALVWHKGKIYAIGGRADKGDSAYEEADFIEVLDYNKEMEWKAYSKPYKYVDGTDDSSVSKRFNLGACSFGDEIFIFGGAQTPEYTRSSAVAFNPETGVVRKLTDMGDSNKLNPCVAVPFGSKIYIFGMISGNLKIVEYTP